MLFVYPARLRRTGPAEVVVSFRDLPECLTSGANEAEALIEASDALDEAIAGRIDDGEPIPVPSVRQVGERGITVQPGMAAKAALALAFRESGLTHVTFAKRIGTDEKSVRRMLNPRCETAVGHIDKALRVLGCHQKSHHLRGFLDVNDKARSQPVSQS